MVHQQLADQRRVAQHPAESGTGTIRGPRRAPDTSSPSEALADQMTRRSCRAAARARWGARSRRMPSGPCRRRRDQYVGSARASWRHRRLRGPLAGSPRRRARGGRGRMSPRRIVSRIAGVTAQVADHPLTVEQVEARIVAGRAMGSPRPTPAFSDGSREYGASTRPVPPHRPRTWRARRRRAARPPLPRGDRRRPASSSPRRRSTWLEPATSHIVAEADSALGAPSWTSRTPATRGLNECAGRGGTWISHRASTSEPSSSPARCPSRAARWSGAGHGAVRRVRSRATR